MIVDNRIPSVPYMELNGVTVYVEDSLPNKLGGTDGIPRVPHMGEMGRRWERRDVKKH